MFSVRDNDGNGARGEAERSNCLFTLVRLSELGTFALAKCRASHGCRVFPRVSCAVPASLGSVDATAAETARRAEWRRAAAR